MINKVDKRWLENEYKAVQTTRLEKKRKKKDAVLQLKEEVKDVYQKALLMSSKYSHCVSLDVL